MSVTMKNKLLWTLQIAIGIYFIAISGLNFIGIAPMVEQFDKIGIGQWFRYVTAICQLLGGVALLTPKFSGYGAVLLASVMVGAIIMRMTILGGNPILALALLLVTGFIAWQRLNAIRLFCCFTRSE